MLNKIIGFSVRNKLIIGLLTFTLIGFGLYEATRLPIDAVPDITDNQVQIITIAPSFGATDIERLVTFPIEQANSNISGIKQIRSFSRFGLSLVTIVFTDATDIYWARQQVSERLQQIQNQIPKGIGTPELGPITTGLGEIYQYVLRAKPGYKEKYNETELRTLQDWVVRRQLLGIKGVAEVSSFGGKLKQYEIAINPARLQAMNLTIADVFSALETNNQNTGGAYIEKGPVVLFIRSEGLLGNKEDIESIAITSTPAGTPIRIKDIAEVNIGYATRYGAMCFNDEGEVAGAVVMMLKGANSSEVIKSVKERIALIQKTMPEGVLIDAFLDRTKMVNNAISTVLKNLLEGALIVVFILVLFLGNFRAGFLVASVIPLAMLFAIIMMNLFGVSGNLMSLGALDFGLIVDGAVIIVEAVMHQLTHSKTFKGVSGISQSEMNAQVESSAGKMMNSAVFGQIIILIVYLPIFTLQGIEGKMFKPMAQTVSFALIGAFILSLTYIPMMSALVLSKKIKHQPNFSDKLMFAIERKYQLALSRILRFPKSVLGSVAVLFFLALVVLANMGGEFIPALEEGDFAVDTRVLTGSNLNTTIEYTQKTAHILKTKFPEVEKVVTKIGSGEVPTDPMPMEAADMMVILKDKSEWVSAKSFPELAEKMSASLSVVPGVTTGFQFPVQMRFNELMTGARQDVVCKIFGENLDTLSYYSTLLGDVVKTVSGSQDLYIEPVTGMPQIIIRYNRSLISQYGLNIEEINQTVRMAFAGESAGLIFEGEKRFDLMVRLNSTMRNNIEDIQNLLIPIRNGEQIPLNHLATVSIENGPNQIQREDAKRRIVVGFNVRARDVQTTVEELQNKIDARIKLPAGYYITYGGAFQNLEEAKQRLAIAVPVSLGLIFILLFFAFNSVKHGLLIYTAIPLSAIGGILLLAWRGLPFSISAGIGFIALFGVAVLNGIVLIAEFNRLKLLGHKNLHRIVLMGTKVRLRPVLMTAIVASLGFLPMAISNGAGAEVQRPLATVVIGGLLLATFLTLFVLPILYILFETINFSKNKLSKSSLLAIIVLTVSLSTTAQSSTISLSAAIDTALKNNLQIKNRALVSEYQRKLRSSGVTIPFANLTVEAGQLNSAYIDTRLGINQSINFPSVYGFQKKLLNEEWHSAALSVAITQAETKKAATQLFYHLILLRAKENLLKSQDSIFAEMLIKSDLRFKVGENNVLEKISAETQRGNIAIQLHQLQSEIEVTKLQFQLILNTERYYEPEAASVILKDDLLVGDISGSSAILKLYEAQTRIAATNLKLERSKLLPDLSFSYFNQSIRGVGADNKTYNSTNRFHAGQFSLGVPIFFGAQKSKINAAKTQVEISENVLLQKSKALQQELSSAQQQYAHQSEIVQYYIKTQLPNAVQIINASNKQYSLGEINYLQWAMLVGQSYQIQTNYIDAVGVLNNLLVEINFLNTNQ